LVSNVKQHPQYAARNGRSALVERDDKGERLRRFSIGIVVTLGSVGGSAISFRPTSTMPPP